MLFLCGYGLFVSGYIAGGSSVPLYIGAGSLSNYTDAQGQVWLSDRSYTGGTVGSTTASIANTADPTLFQNYRTAPSGSFSYTETVSSGGQFRVTELENEPTTSNVLGSRIQNIALSCDSNLVAQHTNFDILSPSGPCGGATTANRACFVNDWIRCGSAGDGQSHSITIAFSPLTGQPITSGIAIVPSPQTAMVAVPTPVPTPGGYPVIGQCVAGLGPANGAAIPLMVTLNSGQSMVLFHKGTTNNPGEFDSYPGQGSISDTWTEAPGAAANSSNCVQASYVINPVSTGSVTVTANSPGSGANNFAVLCTVSGAVMVDLASGQAYPGQAASSNAVTGNVNTFSARDTLLGMIYDEATSPTLSGNWLHNVGLGIINDLTPSLAGTSSNATQVLGLASETDTANNSTYGFQHGLGQAGTGQCGGLIALSATPIPASSVSVSCNPSTISMGGTAQCTATATLVNGTQQTVTASWNSNNPSVASINSSGLITGNAFGFATITGTYQGLSGQTTETVATQVAGTTVNDEFVGPFSNWIYASTADGVAGGTSHSGINTGCGSAPNNGSTDSTSVVQCLFTYLQNNGGTLYFPAGTYVISSTINFTKGAVGERIFGADPSTTMIKWNGGSGGTMINGNGFLYFGQMGRITLNGNNTAGTIISNGQTPATENPYFHDVVFENAADGWTAIWPNGGGQNSEAVFVRCVFLNLSHSGMWGNYGNALDYWFWYCTFLNVGYGVLWGPGGGGIFNSIFIGSTITDIQASYQQPDVFRGNVSLNSNQAFSVGNGSGSDDQQVWQDNRILNTVQSVAINAAQNNTALFLDNQILTRTGNSGPPITQPNGPSGAIMMGNQFTVGAPYISQGGTAKLVEITTSGNVLDNDRTVAASSISTTACPLPISATLAGSTLHFWDGTNSNGTQTLWNGSSGANARSYCYPTPPNMSRQCYSGGAGAHNTCGPSTADETNPSANLAGDISHACADSAAAGGTRPAIHIPVGGYGFSSPISIPANCDVQIFGDGYSGNTTTTLSGTSPIIQIHSPSKAHLDGLRPFGGSGGILIGSEDSPGAHVKVNGSYLYSNVANSRLLTVGATAPLANTLIDVINANGGADLGTTLPPYLVNGNGVSSVASRLALWNSAYGATAAAVSSDFIVTNQGNIVLESGYSEEPHEATELVNYNSSNTGSTTVIGARFAPPTASGADIITANNTSATITISDVEIGPGPCNAVTVTSNDANFLISGGFFPAGSPTSPVTNGLALHNLTNGCSAVSFDSDKGTVTPAAIAAQFAHVRDVGTGTLTSNAPFLNVVSPAGVTDVQIDHVDIESVPNLIEVEKGF